MKLCWKLYCNVHLSPIIVFVKLVVIVLHLSKNLQHMNLIACIRPWKMYVDLKITFSTVVTPFLEISCCDFGIMYSRQMPIGDFPLIFTYLSSFDLDVKVNFGNTWEKWFYFPNFAKTFHIFAELHFCVGWCSITFIWPWPCFLLMLIAVVFVISYYDYDNDEFKRMVLTSGKEDDDDINNV